MPDPPAHLCVQRTVINLSPGDKEYLYTVAKKLGYRTNGTPSVSLLLRTIARKMKDNEPSWLSLLAK